jgi:hypothetical protein
MAVLCDSKLERPRSHRSTPRRRPQRRGEPEKSLTFQSRLPVVPAGLFDAPDLAALTRACPQSERPAEDHDGPPSGRITQLSAFRCGLRSRTPVPAQPEYNTRGFQGAPAVVIDLRPCGWLVTCHGLDLPSPSNQAFSLAADWRGALWCGLRQHRQHRLHDSCLSSDPSKVCSGARTGSTDDADGTDGIFGTRAHPDHSRSGAAFTRERDLDAQRPEKRLCPPQSTGERPRIFCPGRAVRDVSAGTLCTQT